MTTWDRDSTAIYIFAESLTHRNIPDPTKQENMNNGAELLQVNMKKTGGSQLIIFL